MLFGNQCCVRQCCERPRCIFYLQAIVINLAGNTKQESVIIQLHERNQSPIFDNALSMTRSAYFRFKHGFKGYGIVLKQMLTTVLVYV